MKITIFGTGYVGLVTGACFAEMGNTVSCVDIDAARIAALEQGRLPIHEPGLDVLVTHNAQAGRLRFCPSLDDIAADSEVFFIAVGTPLGKMGSPDLSQVLSVAHEIGNHIDHDCVVAGKSTVPVGTADRVQSIIQSALERRRQTVKVAVVSNPEFLKEGDAVNDFMRPNRVVVGASSEAAVETMRTLYAPYIRNHERLMVMGIRDVEMTKYAANAMLATRISFMNEMAALCEPLNVDIENVRRGIGSDSRIGSSFLYAGCGYGGSCFTKDVSALIRTAKDAGVISRILQAVEARNQLQKNILFDKINKRFDGQLAGLKFGLWGLAFKPDTDDLREAPSFVLIERLIAAGATVTAYDPVAMDNAQRCFNPDWFDSGKLRLAANQYEALVGADALALVTEWKPFRLPDFSAMIKVMQQAIVFDGRNQYSA